jgi:hypothetical protein
VEPWAGLLLPRQVLNARDVPLSDGARPQNIPFSLLGVVRLDAERHQTLTNALVLIHVLRAHGLSQ